MTDKLDEITHLTYLQLLFKRGKKNQGGSYFDILKLHIKMIFDILAHD